ncbi:hypothetical protein JVU11DRAFT_3664 [Chiua virens]|nr:hypothetical protein JVU11DRAFT_3664 [Chiua virens]
MSVATVESYLYVSECGVVAAMALLSFDYCLTFRKEVEWLFGTRWTLARIHFTSLRYLPFVALALAITNIPCLTSIGNKLLRTSRHGDKRDVLPVHRTRRRSNSTNISNARLVCLAIAIVPSETIVSQPTTSIYETLDCVGVQGTAAMALQYIGLIVYEMSMLGLNWVAFRRMEKQNLLGQLITSLYHDGMLYMAIISLFSVINAVVALTTSIQYSDTLNSPQMVLHSILASRIFFNLRETSQQEQENQLAITLSEFHAAPQTSDAFLNNSIGKLKLAWRG